LGFMEGMELDIRIVKGNIDAMLKQGMHIARECHCRNRTPPFVFAPITYEY